MPDVPDFPAAGLPEMPPGVTLPMDFNPGFGITVHPELQQHLDVAQSVATGLLGKIRDHIYGEVGKAAALTDGFIDRIQEPLRNTVGLAAQTLIKLQQPIMTDIVGQLGGAMEAAHKLGVVPPVPGGEPVMPAIVQIRQAAMRGDLGPALDAYRLTALPFEGYGGMQYSQAMQSILNALPDSEDVRGRFAEAVRLIAQQQALQPGLPVSSNAAAGLPVTFIDSPGQTGHDIGTRAAADTLQAEQSYLATSSDGGDVTKCAADRAAALAAALAQCAVTYNGYPDRIGICQAQVQQQFLRMPPCVGSGGGGGIPGVPSGPGVGITGPGIPAKPGGFPGGSAGNICPPGYTLGPDGACYLTVPIEPPVTPEPPLIPSGPGGGPGTGGGGGVGSGPGLPSVPPLPPLPPGGPPVSGCKAPDGTVYSVADMTLLLSQLMTSYQQISQAATAFTSQTGIQCYPNLSGSPCDSGYISIVANIAGSATPFQFCVRCSPGSVQPPADKCCPPPTIIVNCPPGGSSPPSPSPGPEFPVAPVPAGPALPPVVNQPIAGCNEFGPAPGIDLPNGLADLSKAVGLRRADGSLNVPIQGAGSITPTGLVVNAIFGAAVETLDQICKGVQQLVQQTGCANGQQMSLLAGSWIADFLTAWLGMDLGIYSIPNKQQRNYLCPTLLPSVDGTAEAWFGNTIDEKTAECWVRAANGRWPEFKKMFQGRKTKLTTFQLGSLLLRGKLTPQQFADRIRELGFIDGTEEAEVRELLKVIPPPSDLVRFMVRDTADKELVKKFGMDDLFDVKFAGKIKEWATASGVSDEYMLSVWEAHWSIPSPGQLYDMYHRSSELAPTDDAYISFEDIKSALIQQDILPFWIPALLNASNTKLGRIDLRRGYQLGVLSENDLINKYQVAGYSQADALRLTDVTKATTTATFKRSPIVSQFANGWLSEDEFKEALSGDGANEETIAACRKRAITIASAKKRKRCTDAYHKRFLIGDLNRADAQSDLLGLGLPADIVDTIIAGWDCERNAAGKALPAGELANLYSQGAIDNSGLVRRLRALGYSYEDAVLLGRRIAATTQQRITKQEQDAIRRQENEDYKQARRENQAIRQATAAAAAGQRRIASIQRVTALRERRLLECGRNFSSHSGQSLSASAAAVSGVYRGLLSSANYMPDEIIGALVTATKDKTITTDAQLASVVTDILRTITA